MTVTERAIARSVDCECPISATTSDSLRSSSVVGSTVYIACRASGSRYALGPYIYTIPAGDSMLIMRSHGVSTAVKRDAADDI